MFALQYDEEGNWLDSPILVESVGTHDGPTFAEDEQAYLDLFASLESLCDYRETLKHLKGINQHYAIEAYELIPGWHEKTPKAYYSEHLSQVQYQYTCENLAKTFWEFLKTLWKHLVRQIRKAIYWMMGKPLPKDAEGSPVVSDAPLTAQEAEEVQEHAQKLQYGIRKKKTALSAFEHTVRSMQQEIHGQGFEMEIGGQRKEYHSLNQLLDDLFSQPEAPAIYKKFYFTTDPLWRDMVTNGPYTQYLLQVSQHLADLTNSITGQLHFFESALHNLNGPDRGVTIPVIKRLGDGSRQVSINGKPQSLTEIQTHLQELRRDWIVQHHESGEARDDYTLFSQKTMHYWSTDSMEKMLDGIIAGAPELAKLSVSAAKIQSLITEAIERIDDTHVGHALRQASEYIASEVVAAGRIASDLGEYALKYKLYVDHSYAMVGYFMRKVQPFMTTHGNGNHLSVVMKSLMAIMDELKD
jgi:hypothetical protein